MAKVSVDESYLKSLEAQNLDLREKAMELEELKRRQETIRFSGHFEPPKRYNFQDQYYQKITKSDISDSLHTSLKPRNEYDSQLIDALAHVSEQIAKMILDKKLGEISIHEQYGETYWEIILPVILNKEDFLSSPRYINYKDLQQWKGKK